MRALITSLVAGSLLAAPAVSAATVPTIATESRDSSPVLAAEQAGDAWIWIGAGLALVLVLLLVLDDGEDDVPASP